MSIGNILAWLSIADISIGNILAVLSTANNKHW